MQNKDINLEFVSAHDQLADIFTKPLREERFCNLRGKLKICDPYIQSMLEASEYKYLIYKSSCVKLIYKESTIQIESYVDIKVSKVLEVSSPSLDS